MEALSITLIMATLVVSLVSYYIYRVKDSEKRSVSPSNNYDSINEYYTALRILFEELDTLCIDKYEFNYFPQLKTTYLYLCYEPYVAYSITYSLHLHKYCLFSLNEEDKIDKIIVYGNIDVLLTYLVTLMRCCDILKQGKCVGGKYEED